MMAKIYEGGLAIDDRGQLSFVNEFTFTDVKRFYMVENYERGFIRAWHAHKNEAKYVYVVSGAALVGIVDLDTEQVERHVLSTRKPQILYIPPNHANGFMNLMDDTKIVFFSTSSLEQSGHDDIRFPYDRWDIWDIERR
jgi:dTDP-4-dehydrorhamnose 3,5-epimerase-like enzyme